ncbi:hypothetical protein LSTR_LSTR007160 [Laodelphax striatellus]|uniref:Uncharacterized protein n=1 Tax=Laodelphax striatellus TaxID=195883 RepID=A0A482WWE5_LAOST|nr:hypothetical protein LSTR_LSTR007160 [Laodelphax striatellus]
MSNLKHQIKEGSGTWKTSGPHSKPPDLEVSKPSRKRRFLWSEILALMWEKKRVLISKGIPILLKYQHRHTSLILKKQENRKREELGDEDEQHNRRIRRQEKEEEEKKQGEVKEEEKVQKKRRQCKIRKRRF